jgi:putative membrane protein
LNTKDVKSFFQRWLITTLSVLVAVYIMPGITYEKPLDLVIASLLLGILNAFLRPLLLLLSLPLLIFTLGLFILIINALLLWVVGALMQPHFRVDGFWTAFWGGLIISIVSLAVNSLTGTGNARFKVHRGRAPEIPKKDDDDHGPVIDV